ncbi:hypothetical protein H2200_012874 [Cladophialophora chaetospira]|uniref:Heterokaryon incompatibility domain-containing protein n=1 Tax=Cladophialophora chaetospira TaxID=386627 RepID=A0AA38WWZ0_9EURO|nr:hypothetical protein H2200_012874 [Cladophialophora chaetospira]
MRCPTCQAIDFIAADDVRDEARYPRYAVYWREAANLAFDKIRQDQAGYHYYLHQLSFGQLELSKDAGCYFCAALWYAFKEPPVYWNRTAIDSKTADSKELPIVLRLWISSRPEYTTSWRDIPNQEYVHAFCGSYEVEMRRVNTPTRKFSTANCHDTDMLDPFSRFSHELEQLSCEGRLLEEESDTGSSLSIDLARTWYKRCLRKHDACAIKQACQITIPILPTRVIDVKVEGTNPVLYESSQGEHGEYVALSHCWGDTQPIRIERDSVDNENRLRQESTELALPPLAQWPKTFRDAVTVVRKFKLQFLWIDNTGVIQGDKDDWARESEKMAQYFGDATFTIAANWGDNDDQGLFHNRNPLLMRPLRIIAPTREPQYKGFYICVTGPTSDYSLSDDQTPLTSRAWVLQEGLLSRRILGFGQRCISWTCFSTKSASEDNPIGREVEPYKHNPLSSIIPMRIQLRLPDHDMMARQKGRNLYFDSWYLTIEDFTRRNMKFKNDVMPAISGLAQAFAPFMDKGDEYVAGLWRNDLKLGLLWTVDRISPQRRLLPPGRVNFDPSGFTGPSWSWIAHCHKSIELRFSYKVLPGGCHDYLHYDDWVGTEIIKVAIAHRSLEQPYGQVLSGSLRVKARLPTLRIEAEPYELTSTDMQKRSYIAGVVSTTHTRRLTMDRKHFPEVFKDMVGDCDMDDMDDRLWRAHLRRGIVTATFLPLIMYDNDEVPTRLVGLALLPVGGRENEFVRIGRAGVDIESAWDVKNCTLPLTQIVVV